MTERTEETKLSAEDTANADYIAQRRDIMKKLAAGAMATPAILSSVSARAGALSGSSPV